MKNSNKKLTDQFGEVIKEAKKVIENADEYSKEELTDARKTIRSVIENAEERLKTYKLEKGKAITEHS